MNIFSTKNPKVKELLKLQKKKSLQYKQHIFIVEGKKEIKMALKKYRPYELFHCKKKCDFLLFTEYKFPVVIELCSNIFQKLVYRKKNVRVIATFHRNYFFTNKLFLPKNPILLILVGIEKPGNLGAIIRSAEVIGIDAVIMSEIKIDIFNPNVCRSSLGTIFIHNVIYYESNNIIKWLIKKKIKTLITCLSENIINFYENKLQLGIAIIVGNESIGLTNKWINKSNKLVKIPMFGNINSLNVSNAVSIILFEILRQRIKL